MKKVFCFLAALLCISVTSALSAPIEIISVDVDYDAGVIVIKGSDLTQPKFDSIVTLGGKVLSVDSFSDSEIIALFAIPQNSHSSFRQQA